MTCYNSPPRLLDLFCSQGGAGMGYHRAGFSVTGVDIKPQPHYPFDFIQGDALEFLAAHGHEYDVIHASPPCQGYCKQTGMEYRANHPRLIPVVRKELQATGKPFVIENVEGARRELDNPMMLCGTMFGLPIQRHRFFEISPMPDVLLTPCNHSVDIVYITGTPRPKTGQRKDPPAETKRQAMGTPWMTIEGMDEAIPPAYTEWIGNQLMPLLAVGAGTYNAEHEGRGI